MQNLRKLIVGFASILCLLLMLLLVLYDSRQHFDAELVELKKKAHSAQKNWNIFYGQKHVYLGGGMRHHDDFKRLKSLLQPGSGMISDVATSYYLASSLPLYFKNVHRHHGRYKSPEWETLISHRVLCYLDAPENLVKFNKVMIEEELRAKKRGLPPVRYIAVNRTHYNDNFKRGCLSQRRRGLLSVIDQVGHSVYEGETISVYRLVDYENKQY